MTIFLTVWSLAGCSADPTAGAGGGAGRGGADASTSGAGGTPGSKTGSGGKQNDAASDGGPLDVTSGLTPPDPSVTFDWTASLPGTGDCRPGRYSGTFNCQYFAMATDPMPLAMVSGPVSITLEQSQDGEFLEIADGKLEGFAMLIIGFRAQLTGRLDCSTHMLDAMAVNGMYGFGDPAIFPFGAFEGTLGGTLDPAAATLNGDWNLTIASGGFCRGPWQANWAP